MGRPATGATIATRARAVKAAAHVEEYRRSGRSRMTRAAPKPSSIAARRRIDVLVPSVEARMKAAANEPRIEPAVLLAYSLPILFAAPAADVVTRRTASGKA